MKTKLPIQSGVRTVQEWITPERAAQDLKNKNPNNRRMNDAVIDAYARDMVNKNWMLNHQGVAYNYKEELIDGQHRLAAVVKAGIPILMNVTYGLRDEQRNGVIIHVMDTVDRMRVRAIGQQLTMFHGISNGNRVAAVCVSICEFLCGGTGALRLTTSQVLHIHKMFKEDIEAIYGITDANTKLPAYVGAPIVLLHHTDKEVALEFAMKLVSLEHLEAGSPVLALIRWRSRNKHGQDIKNLAMRAVCTALRHFKQNNGKLSRLVPALESADWLRGMHKKTELKLRDVLSIEGKAA